MLQLVPVTAGILIALLIDGALESRRQDRLVAEAHAAIAAEIADNAKQLDNALPTLDTVEAQLNGSAIIVSRGAAERFWPAGGAIGTQLTCAVVAIGASWVPARRATRVDPMMALRAD